MLLVIFLVIYSQSIIPHNRILAMILAFAITFFTVASAELRQTTVNFETTKQWSLLAYNFPWDFPANDLEFYNPENVVATGIAVGQDRLFLATPRLFSGVPATISSIPRNNVGDSPILEVNHLFEFD